MPTTKMLLSFSVLVAFCGIIVPVVLVFNKRDMQALLLSAGIFLGCMLIAVLTRMIANMGQIMFELKAEIIRSNELSLNIKEVIQNFSSTLDKKVDYINCDTKDINENINKIKIFFEQIERNLDLKK